MRTFTCAATRKRAPRRRPSICACSMISTASIWSATSSTACRSFRHEPPMPSRRSATSSSTTSSTSPATAMTCRKSPAGGGGKRRRPSRFVRRRPTTSDAWRSRVRRRSGRTQVVRATCMAFAVAPELAPKALTAHDWQSIRTGLEADAIARALIDNLHCLQGRPPQLATRNDWYMALAYTVRDRMTHRYIGTLEAIAGTNTDAKVVAYLSAEFLTGPHLGNGLINLGIWEAVEETLSRLGQDLSNILEQEEEPGLGNGGLGRLAACYMDSLATLNVPAVGYGIRYEYGIFDQTIRNGWQVEVTDKWLRFGNPWEIVRSEIIFDVKLGGHTEDYHDETGRYRVRWVPEKVVKGVACDTPVPGYRVPTTNLLRLWKAEAAESFDFAAFNVGDYYGAVHDKVASETISKVLYPNDEPEAGKELRLEQQYFFVSCSLQDMIRLLLLRGKPLEDLHLYGPSS